MQDWTSILCMQNQKISLQAISKRTHQSAEHDGYQAASRSPYDKIKNVARFGELIVIVAWLERVHQALQNKKADKTADSTSIYHIFLSILTIPSSEGSCTECEDLPSCWISPGRRIQDTHFGEELATLESNTNFLGPS